MAIYGYNEQEQGLLTATIVKDGEHTDASALLKGAPADGEVTILDNAGDDDVIVLTLSAPVDVINLTLTTYLAEGVTVVMSNSEQEQVFESTVRHSISIA